MRVLLLLLTACSAGPHSIDAAWRCDGEASATDWLLRFEAQTSGETEWVDVDVHQGPPLATVPLLEESPGQWYGEAWEDDVGADCEADGLRAVFVAGGPGGQVVAETR